MGFMDKMKAAAQDVATEAKKATAQGKDKLEEVQTRKKMDEAAKKLGYLIHRERTGATPAGAEADRLIAEISGYQTELEVSPTNPTTENVAGGTGTPPADPQAPARDPGDTPPAGDFKL
ncbi:MAG TPA: hypothetical protein VFS18_00385 [Actinomycetota bacterium]|nr:hypothetical protein [Actinomycetota bacterium]